MTDYDAVNHPSHYAEGRKYEPIDVFIDWGLGPLEWQVCKYLSRLGRKGSALEDAKKAQFYMNRLVEELTPPSIDAGKIVGNSVDGTRIVVNDLHEDPDDRPCYCCGKVPTETQPDVYNITVDAAKSIASDGVDHRAVADGVAKQFEEMHRTGRMARASSGSYL